MVEPFSFFVVEFSASLMYFFNGKFSCQFIQCKYFLFCAIIPSQHCKHIDEGLWKKTSFFKTFSHFSCFGILPVHRKYRESIFGAIAFAQFTVRAQYQWEVCPLWHCFFSK